MKIHSVYKADTGLFTGLQISGTPELVRSNIPEGHDIVEGRHHPLEKRVEGGQVVPYFPPKPDARATDWKWDTATHRWQPMPNEADRRAAALAAINARLLLAEAAPFEFRGHPVEANERRITTFAVSALANKSRRVWESDVEQWSALLQCADGYELELDADGMLDLLEALREHLQAATDKARAERAALSGLTGSSTTSG